MKLGQVGLDWQAHGETDPQLERPTEIAAARGNYARAKTELGCEPRTDFSKLVKLMVEADLHKLSAF